MYSFYSERLWLKLQITYIRMPEVRSFGWLFGKTQEGDFSRNSNIGNMNAILVSLVVCVHI